MKKYWKWGILAGVVFYLLGVGPLYGQLAASLLALTLSIAGLALMLGFTKTARSLRRPVGLVLGLFFLPFLIGEILRHIGMADPGLLMLLLLVGLALAIGFSRVRSAKPALPRSGGGKAMPIPRRWRQ
ncbi:MAG: hypothetical protein ACE5JQ_00695 [Candidatus Methylomirabilales bacterium]